MKILVLSDSHSGISYMRRCVESVRPDAIIHLGDYFDDGTVLAEEYPGIPLYQVPGNCDRYRVEPWQPEVLVQRIGGVELYLTHGHRHNVKLTLTSLIRDARMSKAAAALYGHTHQADCHQEEDGRWVLNPGSCRYYVGSAGLIVTDNEKIVACRILRQNDLEAFL